MDRYIIREDVQLTDQTPDMGELLIAGPGAENCLAHAFSIQPPADPLAHVTVVWETNTLSVRRVPFAGSDCYFVVGPRQLRDPLLSRIRSCGAVMCGHEALEIARIEAGSPVFGQDICQENLPQEIDRNDTAISFSKGCYLGQETVARLDALGHVNRMLRGLRIDGPQVPPRDTVLECDDKAVAQLTSSAWSYRLDSPLALALVRRGTDTPGTTIASPFGPVTVVALPPP
jgi:folate-binding protein YgfZ